MQNKAEAQPAWLQLAAGAGSWGLTELGKNHVAQMKRSSLEYHPQAHTIPKNSLIGESR